MKTIEAQHKVTYTCLTQLLTKLDKVQCINSSYLSTIHACFMMSKCTDSRDYSGSILNLILMAMRRCKDKISVDAMPNTAQEYRLTHAHIIKALSRHKKADMQEWIIHFNSVKLT